MSGPRFCSGCGAELRPGARFCHGCGRTSAPAYPAAPAPPPQIEPPRGASSNSGWIVAGAVAAALAVAGVGVGIYFAASSGSGGQARLLAVPTAASSNTAAPSGGSAAPEPTSSPSVPGTSAAAPSPAIAHPASSPPTRIGQHSETQAVADTIQRHFALIQEHKFSAAYAILAPSLQSGESAWVQSHREDGIYQVTVSVEAKLSSSTSAAATIVKMQTLDGHGCKNWSGSWGLTKIAGQWRISESNLSFTPC